MTCFGKDCVEAKPTLIRRFLEYNEADVLGEGSFGVVYRGKYLRTPVAIKKIKDFGTTARQNYDADLAALTSLRHVNIVNILAHGYGLLVMPLCSASLQSFVARQGHEHAGRAMRFGDFGTVVTHCCTALLYMHHQVPGCAAHNDLKMDNVLLELDRDGSVHRALLGDVGLSRACAEIHGHHWIGTPGYQPQLPQLNPGADIHALAVTFMSAWSYPMLISSPYSVADTPILCNTLEEGMNASPDILQSLFHNMLRAPSNYTSERDFSLLTSAIDIIRTSTRNPNESRTDAEMLTFCTQWVKALAKTQTFLKDSESKGVQHDLLRYQRDVITQQADMAKLAMSSPVKRPIDDPMSIDMA